eukprot:jgi/Tetstr1/432511/TSEL_021885.t1
MLTSGKKNGPRGRQYDEHVCCRSATAFPGASESASRRLVGRLRATEDREVWAGEEDEEERDEDGLYIGTYSTFFTDPAQIKGVAAFCLVLTCFFGGGQVLSGLLLPYLFGGGRGLHTDLLSWDYWTKF